MGNDSCDTAPALEDNLIDAVANNTAGNPMQEDVVRTCLSSMEIVDCLAELGTHVYSEIVISLLSDMGYHERQAE